MVGRSPQKSLQRLQQGTDGGCVLLTGQRLQQAIVQGQEHASQGRRERREPPAGSMIAQIKTQRLRLDLPSKHYTTWHAASQRCSRCQARRQARLRVVDSKANSLQTCMSKV